MISQNTLLQLSRRQWLRDTAIAATSAVMLPSVLIGCTDHRIPPTVGVGDVPLTTDELAAAAQNLINMVDWLRDLHISQTDYEIDVLEWLKSGTDKPSGWSNFIINILLDIAVGIITAAAEAAGAVTAGASAIAGLAIASELIKQFAFSENRPHDLDGAFVEFKHGQDKLYEAIKNKLLIVADKKDNYKNLQEGWPGDIDFNGKKFTLRDLANSHFPTEGDGTTYVDLQTAALDKFKRSIWNVMFIKAGSMKSSPYWTVYFDDDLKPPAYYGRVKHYKPYPATYLRGKMPQYYGYMEYREWLFTFDGRELSADAGKELFKDDTPGNIINSTGLFNRDYVFKQFHQEKPDFMGYHDLKKDLAWGPYDEKHSDAYGYEWIDDFVFTGGDFPQLIKK